MRRFRTLFLTIALTGAWGGAPGIALSAQAQPAAGAESNGHQVYGTIRSIQGAQFALETRDKRTVTCDATEAIKNHRTIRLAAGQHVAVSGSYDKKGVLKAGAIQRAKDSAGVWPADR